MYLLLTIYYSLTWMYTCISSIQWVFYTHSKIHYYTPSQVKETPNPKPQKRAGISHPKILRFFKILGFPWILGFPKILGCEISPLFWGSADRLKSAEPQIKRKSKVPPADPRKARCNRRSTLFKSGRNKISGLIESLILSNIATTMYKSKIWKQKKNTKCYNNACEINQKKLGLLRKAAIVFWQENIKNTLSVIQYAYDKNIKQQKKLWVTL